MAERHSQSGAPAERSVPVGALASPYSVTGPGGPLSLHCEWLDWSR